MKKAIQIALAALVLTCFYVSSALAGGCPGSERHDFAPCCSTFNVPSGGSEEDRTCVGPATSYVFTIHEFGFENTDGERLVFGSDQSFDAASVSAGSAVGAYLSGQTLPSGTYTHMRPTISQNFTVQADITTNDGRRCTGTATGGEDDYQACNSEFRTDDDSHGDNCVLDGKQYIRDNQLGTFTYTEGDPLNLNFGFYTESSVKCVFPAGGTGDGTVSVGPLNVVTTKN